jgi:hypothetical protein
VVHGARSPRKIFEGFWFSKPPGNPAIGRGHVHRRVAGPAERSRLSRMGGEQTRPVDAAALGRSSSRLGKARRSNSRPQIIAQTVS